MDDSRLFIANLSKGRMGHDKANLLGSLLVTQFQLAAMARTKQPEKERRDFYLFIDEFQNFSTDAFAAILAEARKYRLCLTLSHQYSNQLTPAVRDAVFGNVGSIISFRIGYTDAEILAHEFAREYPPEAFVDLPRFETIARMHEDGQLDVPFRAITLAPISTQAGSPEKLIARSRERFSSARKSVEDRITRWLGG